MKNDENKKLDEITEYDEHMYCLIYYRNKKIKVDFVERKEKAMISLEEGNLSRADQPLNPINISLNNRKYKICASCVYAKVIYIPF